ncbi:MAG: hypothetical protein ACKPEO_21210 [Sphaerospermopsis kisseleviana]
MNTESNNHFEDEQENISVSENDYIDDEKIIFDQERFAEVIFNKIFYGKVEEDVFCEKYIYTEDVERVKEVFKEVFLPLVAIDESIRECLEYLEVDECEKDLERFILIAREQTLLISYMENIYEKILGKLSAINGNFYRIDRKIDHLTNISVSYEYKKLRIYAATRKQRKTREIGSWLNKKTEVYYEDAHYFIITENGEEVNHIERSEWEEVSENQFLSIFNRYYGIKGWELFNLPEQVYGGYEGYECMIKKQTKS